MAFLIHSTEDHRVPVIEYLPCGAITPQVGMALAMTNGNLVAATGTTKPQYICMTTKDTACTAGDIIPVTRIQPDMIIETSFSAAASAVKLGNKVTVSADGTQVTATTEGGVAEVVYMDGTAAGDMCRVRIA